MAKSNRNGRDWRNENWNITPVFYRIIKNSKNY